jgi:hypothetical protein
MSLLPQDNEGREKLAEEIERVVNILKEIDVLKGNIKEIADDVEDTLNVKKAAFNKLAKSKFNQDATANRKEAEEIEETLDILYTD